MIRGRPYLLRGLVLAAAVAGVLAVLVTATPVDQLPAEREGDEHEYEHDHEERGGEREDH